MGTAFGKKKRSREVFEAAKSGDTVLLNAVLEEMGFSERTSALKTKMHSSFFRDDVNDYETFKVTPLIAAAKNGNVDCVKVLLKHQERGGRWKPWCDADLDVLSCLVKNAIIRNAIIVESPIIRERIIGTYTEELLVPIRKAAHDVLRDGTFLYEALCRHAIKIAQSCNKPAICDLTNFFNNKFGSYDPARRKEILELLGQIILECEKQQKLRSESVQFRFKIYEPRLFDSAMILVSAIAKFKLYEEGKSSCLSVLLKRLCCLNPRNSKGDTLLHKAVEELPDYAFLYLDTVKLLLNVGFSVNAINNNWDTPLHRAVTFQFGNYVPLVTDMLELLLNGGAHHDFVNSDGKTAMDLAQTDEARWILTEKRKLELKCISARAVKKFGVPYLCVVPKILEKYISMH